MIITTCAWAVAQLCLTFCNAMDCSLPGSSVHGISQARKLEWVAISFSRGSSRPRNQPSSPVSPVLAGRFFTTASPGKLIITMGLPDSNQPSLLFQIQKSRAHTQTYSEYTALTTKYRYCSSYVTKATYPNMEL